MTDQVTTQEIEANTEELTQANLEQVAGGFGGGGGAGKVSMQDFHFVMRNNSAAQRSIIAVL